MRHSVSRRGCPSDSKCCLKTADLSQHSSDCLQDTSVPRHARLSRDISGSARAMACVETGRLITAPCVARHEVRNRCRTEMQLNNTTAQSTVQSVPPHEKMAAAAAVQPTDDAAARGAKTSGAIASCEVRQHARGSASVARALPISMHPVRRARVCAVLPGRARQV